jgi:cation diffusion facilitator family transporter
MSVSPLSPEADAAKRRAAASSIFWSGFLTALKLAAGLASNSLGVLSEALHSALDLLAAGLTFLAVRVAAAPADKSHPFGHGKVENLSALAETALLFVTCTWIIREAVERLFFDAPPVEPDWWVFAVVLVSLAVDLNRSAMLRRVARQHRSQAIEADALHFATDVWSSSVVLVGLACVFVAGRIDDPASWPALILGRADAVAALAVAGIVLGISWRLAKKSVLALMDGGGDKEARLLSAVLEEKAPAFRIRRIRVRESGARFFVDLVVTAPPGLRVDAAHDVTDRLEALVSGVLPGSETAIHMEPEEVFHDLHAESHRLASLHGFSLHALTVASLEDGPHIFVHIEMDPDMPLTEAHARVSAFEGELGARVGATHVTTHIEPTRRHASGTGGTGDPPKREAVLFVLRELMEKQTALYGCFDEEVWILSHHASLSFRCRTDASVSVGEAHKRASWLEAELRRRLPALADVTIHVEPDEGFLPHSH